MFGTQGISESAGLREGIQVVTIARWSAGENANGKPFLAVYLYPKGGDPEKARAFQFYLTTDKAVSATMKKVLHICSKVVKRSVLDEATASTAEQYANNLTALTAGKSLRIVFDGEEYYKDGQLRVAAKLNRLRDFAEAVEPGAEYSPVADKDTQLVFDREAHVVKAQVPDAEDVSVPSDDY